MTAPYRRAGLFLAILTGLNLFNYFDRYILAAVLEQVGAEFALTDSQLGLLSTAFMLGYFLTCPIFGYLGDAYARRYLIMGGIFVWSLATLMTGFSTSYDELLVWRVFVGVGEASYATISPSLIADIFGPRKRNNALTIFYVATPLGAAAGSLIGSWIGANHGWHQAFIWAGAPGLLLAFSLWPFREPARGSADGVTAAAAYTRPRLRDVGKLFRIPAFNFVIWGYVAYTYALGAYQHWGQAYLQRVHGLEQEAAGLFFGGIMVLAGLVGTFLGGFGATAWQRKNPRGYALTLGWSVLLAVPFAVSFASLESREGVMVSVAAAMFLLFLSTGPVNTVILESVPVNLRASAMALSIFLIHAFGDLWSPLIVGRVSDATGSLAAGLNTLPPALLVCGLLWLALASERFISHKK